MRSSRDVLPRRVLAAILLVAPFPALWAGVVWAQDAPVAVLTDEPFASGPPPGTRAQAPVTLIETLDGIPIHRIHVETRVHSTVGVTIDGVVNEPDWATVLPYDNMLVAVPATGKPGRYPTELRLIATEEGLYVSAILYQPPDTLVTRRTIRDEFIDRDSFGITLDTTGVGKFGYWFTLSLGDSQQDGKVLPERSYSRDWDGPWIGRTSPRPDGWSAEIYFPWSMLNLPNSGASRVVGFSTSRQVSHENARYQWPGHAYSSSRFVTALNHMELDGIAPRKEISVIPFGAYTLDEHHDDAEPRVGADFTWKPSPAAEFAGTVLPDFGSVESDDVVLNLTAQETFFPEKRLFFLEGAEVFETSLRGSPGNQQRFTTNENYASTSRRVFMNTFVPAPISLFNTRRIGGTPTQVEFEPGVLPERGELSLPTDLYGALKATGNVGALRYGLLGASEEDIDLDGVDADGVPVAISGAGRDFGTARLLYEHIATSRYSIGYLGTAVQGPVYDAYVHGIDGRFTSATGQWMAESLVIASDRADVDGNAAQLDVQYAPDSRIQHRVGLEWFDDTVDFNDLGFVQRNDYRGAQYNLMYADPVPHGIASDIRGTLIFNGKVSESADHLVDGGVFWRNSMVLPGRNTLRSGFGWLPEAWEDRDSRGNGAYRTDDRVWAELLLTTDASRRGSWSANVSALQEDLGGWAWLVGGGVTWRPLDAMTVDLDLKYRDREGWIVYQGGRNFGEYDAEELQPAVKFNWFPAAGHQIGFTLQWVGVQADGKRFLTIPAGDGDLTPTQAPPNYDFTASLLTLQARYRWEIAPLTDFYLVYNRGNTLPNQVQEDFDQLFQSAIEEPIIDYLVAKLRWRFSN
jgi:hypothetical protein